MKNPVTSHYRKSLLLLNRTDFPIAWLQAFAQNRQFFNQVQWLSMQKYFTLVLWTATISFQNTWYRSSGCSSIFPPRKPHTEKPPTLQRSSPPFKFRWFNCSRGHGVIKQITEIIMVKNKEEKKSRRGRQNIFNNLVYTVAPKTLASAQRRGSTLGCTLGNFSKVCNQNKSNQKITELHLQQPPPQSAGAQTKIKPCCGLLKQDCSIFLTDFPEVFMN